MGLHYMIRACYAVPCTLDGVFSNSLHTVSDFVAVRDASTDCGGAFRTLPHHCYRLNDIDLCYTYKNRLRYLCDLIGWWRGAVQAHYALASARNPTRREPQS